MALATSTSLLGLATSSLESSLTTILMESVLKLSSLTDANVFVMVESASEGRCWAGRKQLRDSFLSGCLQPESTDIEFDVDPHVTCIVKKATPLPPHSGSPLGVHQKKQKQMRQLLAGPPDPPSGGPGPPSPPLPRVDRDPTLRHHSGQHASSSNDHSSSRKRANSDRDSARTVQQQQLPQLSNSLALSAAVPNLRFSPQYPAKQSNLLLSPVTTLTVTSSKQSNILRTSELIEDISPPLSSKPPDHPLLQHPPPPTQHLGPLQQLNVTNVSNDAHLLSSPPVNTNRLSPRYPPSTHSKRSELLLTGSIDAASLLKEESSHHYEREPENDDRDIKHAVSFFDRAQRAFQQELANVAAAATCPTADSQSCAVLDMLSRQEHANSLENRMRSDSAASGDASQSRYPSIVESSLGPPGGCGGGKMGAAGVSAHGSERVNRFLDATLRFPPLGIDIPITSAGHEGGGGAGGGGSPNASDNGMGDYEDDIPAGGSAFGSGGTSAPGLSQGNATTQRGGDYPPSQSEPQPGSSRDTGRPPGGGGGGPFEAEAAINLDTLAGLKGLDPNSETIVRYPSQRGKTKLCYKGWRYVFDRPVSKPFPLHLFLCMYKRDKKCKGAVWIDPVTEAVHKTVDHDYDLTPQYEAARREVEDRLQFSLYYSNMQTHNPTNPMAGTPGLNYPPI